MARKQRDVTGAELTVLQYLWDHEPATIRDITNAVYPRGGESKYATVKKLLARLEAKELVTRDASRMTHEFAAAINQDDLIQRRLQDLANALCEGSQTPLLMNLLRNRRYTAKERKQLHDLFDELFGSSGPK